MEIFPALLLLSVTDFDGPWLSVLKRPFKDRAIG